MAKKNSTIFVCSECGYESSKWLGKCPSCNSWNSFYEEKAINTSSATSSKTKSKTEAVKLNEVKQTETVRVTTGLGELDRVLGGGFVLGSLTLLGGEPGIGKSTYKYAIQLKLMVQFYIFQGKNQLSKLN